MSDGPKTVRLIPVEVLLTFLERYQSMREAQRKYFVGRDREALAHSLHLERTLDAHARQLLLDYAEQERLQKSLFG